MRNSVNLEEGTNDTGNVYLGVARYDNSKICPWYDISTSREQFYFNWISEPTKKTEEYSVSSGAGWSTSEKNAEHKLVCASKIPEEENQNFDIDFNCSNFTFEHECNGDSIKLNVKNCFTGSFHAINPSTNETCEIYRSNKCGLSYTLSRFDSW